MKLAYRKCVWFRSLFHTTEPNVQICMQQLADVVSGLCRLCKIGANIISPTLLHNSFGNYVPLILLTYSVQP